MTEFVVVMTVYVYGSHIAPFMLRVRAENVFTASLRAKESASEIIGLGGVEVVAAFPADSAYLNGDFSLLNDLSSVVDHLR